MMSNRVGLLQRTGTERIESDSDANSPKNILFDDDDDVDNDDDYARCRMNGGGGNGADPNCTDNGESGAKSLLETSKENKVVLGSKFLVYVVLTMAAFGVGFVAYVFLRNEEDESFQRDFRAFAREIISVSNSNAFNTASVMKGLSVAVTSYVESSSLDAGYDAPQWPNVTVPEWERRAWQSLGLSAAEVFGLIIDVPASKLKQFEEYAQYNQQWLHDGMEFYQIKDENGEIVDPGPIPKESHPAIVSGDIALSLEDVKEQTQRAGLEEPIHRLVWQMAPPPQDAGVVLQDLRRSLWFTAFEGVSQQIDGALLAQIRDLRFLLPQDSAEVSFKTMMIHPLYQGIDLIEYRKKRAGYIMAVIEWDSFFSDILPPNMNGFLVVVRDGCRAVVSYEINGRTATYLGLGDFHDPKYYSYKIESEFAAYQEWDGTDIDSGEFGSAFCQYTIEVYPTSTLEESYEGSDPWLYAGVVVFVFFSTGMVFALYDWAVQRRQDTVLSTAQRTTAIVASLFPRSVQQRLLQETNGSNDATGANLSKWSKKKSGELGEGDEVISATPSNDWAGLMMEKHVAAKNQLKNFLNEDESASAKTKGSGKTNHSQPAFLTTKPIADLFTATTIMFADLVGFTAWSSTREPSQVFTLLETIYHAFDVIARRRRVFKVETVGDCYVAVAGLPEPRADHAVVMARFARDCLNRLMKLTQQLEETLGPDTADLALRVGLHSGPVTAGVLRGEKARFQLFGDTVNTTSRMESTSKPNKIQMSQETADLLIEAGKAQWIRQRADKVVAKGKGELQTYWLDLRGDLAGSVVAAPKADTPTIEGNAANVASNGEGSPSSLDPKAVCSALDEQQHQHVAQVLTEKIRLSEKHARLVNWNSEVLGGLLNEIATRRRLTRVRSDHPDLLRKLEKELLENKGLVLDEVKDIITLPRFSSTVFKKEQGIRSSTKRAAGLRASQTFRPVQEEEVDDTLSEEVLKQLHDFVEAVAAMYRDNPFHGFEHASHVTMSVVKLLARIVAPDLTQQQLNEQTLHDHTYGITSDPLTQFVCVFTALIHDLDHPGVPNSQLVKEKSSLAVAYKNKSVAEQNSVDLAWDLLMEDKFVDLRQAIYTTETEFRRFRQLLVNSVMATDVMDKDLGAARKARWNKAFAAKPEEPGDEEGKTSVEDDQDAVNRKATIVLEHLIQASDVAHTMQHWHIYRKWNSRLFEEMYLAYRSGRMEKDPAENWYKGEIGFFDFYVIPLAKKLKDCGVFGVSSDEYLIYAQKNRQEWEMKGQEVVAELLEQRKEKFNE